MKADARAVAYMAILYVISEMRRAKAAAADRKTGGWEELADRAMWAANKEYDLLLKECGR